MMSKQSTNRNRRTHRDLEVAVGRLRSCSDALLRHLARQIERDELSQDTAFEMLERFEVATAAQLRQTGSGRDREALEARHSILNAVLRRERKPRSRGPLESHSDGGRRSMTGRGRHAI